MSNPLNIELNENGLPPFDSLPLRQGDPPFSAWGLYGDKDELGTLNRLSDERVAAAAREEIKTGKRRVSRTLVDAAQRTFGARTARVFG